MLDLGEVNRLRRKNRAKFSTSLRSLGSRHRGWVPRYFFLSWPPVNQWKRMEQSCSRGGRKRKWCSKKERRKERGRSMGVIRVKTENGWKNFEEKIVGGFRIRPSTWRAYDFKKISIKLWEKSTIIILSILLYFMRTHVEYKYLRKW